MDSTLFLLSAEIREMASYISPFHIDSSTKQNELSGWLSCTLATLKTQSSAALVGQGEARLLCSLIRLGRLEFQEGDPAEWQVILGDREPPLCLTPHPVHDSGLNDLDWCNMLISWSAPNGLPQKLEGWTSVLWGVLFYAFGLVRSRWAQAA